MAIKWDWLDTQQMKDRLIYAYRSKVPGGWMVMIVLQSTRTHVSSFLYPDPEHAWDGSSLP